jgi:hypothetical protein
MRALFVLFMAMFVCALHGEDWGPAQFLIGEWTGEGGGQPGTAFAGDFSFTPELQGAILVRRSFAEYPAANGRPAFRHDDLTVVYRDAASRQLKATYWDSEGHMIPYAMLAAANGVVFESEAPRSATRYRLTYTSAGKGQVKIRFELAAPGKDFAAYIEASARRK